MDAHTQMLLEEYDELLPTLEKINEILVNFLNSEFKEKITIVNSFETRVKSRKSLQGKLDLKGYKYNSVMDLSDLVGGRIITFYQDGIDKVAATISEALDVDWTNTVDKRKQFEVDKFGYASLHYVCRIPEKLFKDPAYPKLNDIRIEIQMRTILQHAWASISHDTGYKNDVEVPREILRTLNSLAGLLEIADKEFFNLRNTLDDYRRRVKGVVASGKFDDVELDIESFNAYVQSGAFEKLNRRIASINNMEIEEMPFTPFLSTLKKLNFETLGDVDRMLKQYSEEAYQLALRQLNDLDVDIVGSTIGILNLIVVYIIKSGFGDVGVKMLLDHIYGERKYNEKFAKRILENAKNAGI